MRTPRAFHAGWFSRARPTAGPALNDAGGHSPQPRRPAHRGSVVDPNQQEGLNRRLVYLLMVARLAMTVTGVIAVLVLSDRPLAQLPWALILGALGAVAIVTFSAYLRLGRPQGLDHTVFMLHLLCDIVVLTAVFQYSGGVENPFLVFYALPLTLAAYALTWPWVLGAAGVVGLALISLHRLHEDSLTFGREVHEISELIAVAVVTYFAYAVAMQSRSHERAVARQREELLDAHGERSRGVVAALAADSISSPLATMSVLVNELEKSPLSADERLDALHQLASQIDRCKSSLSELLASVGLPRGHSGQRRRVDAVLRSAASRCELMNPRLRVQFAQIAPTAPLIVDERSLSDAFVLLIDDLGREAPHAVRIAVEWNASAITVQLCSDSDRQPQNPAGIARCETDVADSALTEVAASLIERFAGWLSRETGGGGSRVTVWLPLSSISAEETLANGTPAGATAVR